jgi:NitT/TauT family transport system permease protein
MAEGVAIDMGRAGRRPRAAQAPGVLTYRILPLAVVGFVILVLWYLGAIGMNADLQRDAFSNAGQASYTTADLIAGTWSQERPRLPAPHQIVAEIDKSIFRTPVTSKRSLLYHALITIEATLLGFGLGAGLGILLSILVVHSRSLDRGMMPWLVASQTVPVVALAPMIVVILNQFDVTGIVPKAVIAAYLSFFPVTVGMVKGLRSPDPLQRDLMRTYSASLTQTLTKLRLPASLPFFFTSLKIGVAASLVGTIVAEVTKSEDGGLGARLLAGSYYGQTIQIWAALIVAALVAAALVGLIGLAERITSHRLGGAP